MDKVNDLSDLDSFWDTRIGTLLTMAQRVAFNCYSTMLDQLKITPSEAAILSLLAQQDTVTTGALAEMYRVKPPVVTALVDELVRLELVKRCSHPDDRRRSILVATEKGRQMILEIDVIADQMQNLLTANLSEQEAVQLTLSLKKVIYSVEGKKSR